MAKRALKDEESESESSSGSAEEAVMLSDEQLYKLQKQVREANIADLAKSVLTLVTALYRPSLVTLISLTTIASCRPRIFRLRTRRTCST